MIFELQVSSQRKKPYEKNLPVGVPLKSTVGLGTLAKKYPLTGANIVNIVHQVGLRCMASNENCIKESVLTKAIKNELGKEGKMH